MSIWSNPVRRTPIAISESRPSTSALATRISAPEIETMVAGVVAGLAYCSWPFGYLVNSSLAASALASDLEARGQPFNWLFILLDCVTGLATLVACARAWPHRGSYHYRSSQMALLAYAFFGIATAVDALIPVGCGSGTSLAECGVDLHHLNADDYLTAVAIFALFVAAVLTQALSARAHTRSPAVFGSLGVTATWVVCGLVFFLVHFSTHPAVSLQHLMLTLTSAVAVMVPIAFAAYRRAATLASAP